MQTTDKTETKRTKYVISNGNGGTCVLSVTGNPSAAATKFFHDAVKHKRQNNTINIRRPQTTAKV